MRTSAAPYYFPVYQGYIDGAVFANNPSLAAIAKVFAHFPSISLQNIVVLSIGSGNFNYKIKDTDYDWGLRQWAPHLMTLLMDSAMMSMNSSLHLFLKDQYHRLDPQLEKQISLDSVEDIPELVKISKQVDISQTLEFVEKYF
jgi:patatin-like phospholipase/acyl hydrolase